MVRLLAVSATVTAQKWAMALRRPSGAKRIRETHPTKVSGKKSRPGVICQVFTVPSSLLETRVLPSRLKATAVTPPVWPRRCLTSRPSATFQILIVPSSLAEASRAPSGLKATPRMAPLCPRNDLKPGPDRGLVSSTALPVLPNPIRPSAGLTARPRLFSGKLRTPLSASQMRRHPPHTEEESKRRPSRLKVTDEKLQPWRWYRVRITLPRARSHCLISNPLLRNVSNAPCVLEAT
jgi:hypothetical protein